MQLPATRPLVQSPRELQQKAHANANLQGVALSYYDSPPNPADTYLWAMPGISHSSMRLIVNSSAIFVQKLFSNVNMWKFTPKFHVMFWFKS